jgi:hypothetical protein
MATVSHAHFEFMEATTFAVGDTRVKNIYLPALAAGWYVETAVAASATPFNASNQDRRLEVTSLSIKAKDPNPNTGDLPIVKVKIECLGPDEPVIWYLNLSLVEP